VPIASANGETNRFIEWRCRNFAYRQVLGRVVN
jgi:hypothetical protein